MGFINEEGKSISYECSGLIEELREDIKEFGGNTIVAVWCKKMDGVVIYTNYDFITPDLPLMKDETDGEYIDKMTMTTLLMLLEEQNKIL